MGQQWTAFARRNRLKAPSPAEVVGQLLRFLELVLAALILLCQFGEVCDQDGEQSAGEVALDASDDFAVGVSLLGAALGVGGGGGVVGAMAAFGELQPVL